jgi:thiamine pyrophosphate-dependent acetolactate synthase large subunit-like protein
MGRTVSDQIVDFLYAAGVRCVFGIPGDTIDSLMESFRKRPEIRFVLVRHEETGAFAASAQAKMTGRLAVCVACQGPGAIHLLNGLYDAAMDRVPVLAITGQVDSSLIGTQMVQEINQISLFQDLASYNQEVRSAANLPGVLAQAIRVALTRPGVSHVSIPSDVMREEAVHATIPPLLDRPSGFGSGPEFSKEEIRSIGTLLKGKTKVTILYGGGARDAVGPLLTLAGRLSAPLVYTTRSKDVVENNHPHVVGGIGLMGSRAGNYAATHAEALLVVGSSFAFREYYPEGIPIIQIDRDPTRLGLHVPATHVLAADAKTALSALAELDCANADRSFLETCMHRRDAEWGRQEKYEPGSRRERRISPQEVVRGVGERAREDTVFCVDSGSVSVFANNYLHLKGSQRLLWSWNLASLACSLPYAIGVGILEPGRPIVVLAGDSGFEMLIGDLSTLAQYGIEAVVVVFNNGTNRFIEFEEMQEGNPVWGTRFVNPDYAQLAGAFGFRGIRAATPDLLPRALDEAFSGSGVVLVDAAVDPDALFIPPVLNARMVTGFLKSQIRSLFAHNPPELPTD